MKTTQHSNLKVADGDICLSLNDINVMSTEVLSQPEVLLDLCSSLSFLIGEFLNHGGDSKLSTESMILLGGLIKYANNLNSKIIAFDKEHSK
ncbi:hypothetical protein ACRN91_14285 [Shewanella baltica]|uniref:hypothetical protein n=1 Tax=Shewanella baltica TaxID=62322 RepID=UPI003D7B0519